MIINNKPRLLVQMKFLDTVEEVFDTRDLYEVLGLTKEAKESEIKRAYYKLSLKVHPDRVELDKIEEATLKFQVSRKSLYILLKIVKGSQ